MASTKFTVPARTWTQITTTSKDGSVFVTQAPSPVSFVEADSAPSDYVAGDPTLNILDQGKGFPYHSIASDEFMFAWCETEAVISVNPVGV